MDSDQKRLFIAEKCGWRNVVRSGRLDGWYWGFPPGQIGGIPSMIPDYTQDLNAMFDAEEVLKVNASDWIQYWHELLAVTDCSGKFGMLNAVHATAQQRADAFIKTLEKGK